MCVVCARVDLYGLDGCDMVANGLPLCVWVAVFVVSCNGCAYVICDAGGSLVGVPMACCAVI